MARSNDWDQWYEQFAMTLGPLAQRVIDRKLEVDVDGFWTIERQYVAVAPAAIARFSEAPPGDVSWLVEALRSERKRWFVARLAALADSVPEPLFEPMLIAAVELEDPSRNALFIRPCTKSFSAERVHQYLVRLASSDDPRRVVGAIDAMYWTGYQASSDDLFERRKVFLLEACLSKTSTYVRNRILALLTQHGTQTLDPSLFPESHRQRVAQAQILWDELILKINESRSC